MRIVAALMCLLTFTVVSAQTEASRMLLSSGFIEGKDRNVVCRGILGQRITSRTSSQHEAGLGFWYRAYVSSSARPIIAVSVVNDTIDVGESKAIRLRIDRLDGFASNEPVSVQGHFDVDATTLLSNAVGSGATFDVERLVLEFSAVIHTGTTFIEGPIVTAKLGSHESTSVMWRDFSVDSVATPIVILGDGEITIGGICREGEGTRLVRSSESASIRIGGTHPARDVVDIIVTTLESGAHTLTVYDVSGRTMRTVNIDGSSRKQVMLISTAEWARGMYVVNMITPSEESLTATVYVEP